MIGDVFKIKSGNTNKFMTAYKKKHPDTKFQFLYMSYVGLSSYYGFRIVDQNIIDRLKI